MPPDYHHINHHGSHHIRDDGNAAVSGFRCVEVITGARRRRGWSDEEKLAIIAESFSTATSASEVARRHGINKNQLFQWRRQFRGGRFEVGAERVDFVAVVDGGADDPAVIAPVPGARGFGSSEPGAIEMVVGGMTVRVPLSADEATLRRVLGVVKALA